MNVLITNSQFDGLGGAQSFVMDLGRSLQKLGHSVIAYSRCPGDQDLLRERGMVPVTDRLDDLPFLPDIIHGQHHLDAMAAIIGLPGVPALYHCHGAVWRECAPKHPRIYRYLAMSRTLAYRMAVESNLDPSDITVWLNTVQLERFTKVRSLPAKPMRGLVYNKMHGPESPVVAAINEAASRLGITMDYAGRHFDKMIPEPQKVLPGYDIVFASGKSAIDALASGCAVVVLGRTSCGEMVQPENFDRFREVNFAIAVNSPPPSADKVEGELFRYSARKCAEVVRRLREQASATTAIENLTDIYADVIQRHRGKREDLPAEMRAAASYFRRISPLFRITDAVLGAAGRDHPGSPRESTGTPVFDVED